MTKSIAGDCNSNASLDPKLLQNGFVVASTQSVPSPYNEVIISSNNSSNSNAHLTVSSSFSQQQHSNNSPLIWSTHNSTPTVVKNLSLVSPVREFTSKPENSSVGENFTDLIKDFFNKTASLRLLRSK